MDFTNAISDPENDEDADIFACNGVREDAFGKATQSSLDEQWPPAHVSGKNVVFDYDPDEIAGRAMAEVDAPRASIMTSSRMGQNSVDENIALSALPLVFDTTENDQGDISFSWSIDGTSIMGVVAGASSLDLPESGGEHCSTVTRTPETDTDGDGMDDAWEQRYFVDTAAFGSIAEVLPGDDYDQDGIIADQFLSSDSGQALINSPTTSVGPPGDGIFTNLEEYIWGTDPIDADTDDDGFIDGEDILGLGQSSIELDPTIFISESTNRFNVRLTILGYWAARDNENNRIAKLDSTEEVVIVSEEEDMEVSLRLENRTTPRPGDIIKVQAQVRDTRSLSDVLNYRWYVNGVEQVDASGAGAHILNYPLSTAVAPETKVEIRVEAYNETTGDIAEDTIYFQVGQLVAFEYDPVKVFQGNEITVGTIFPDTIEKDDYVFRWTIDGIQQKTKSGLGQDEIEFVIDKPEFETHTVELDIIRRYDSTVLATISEEIGIISPKVTLVITPEVIAPGSTVTLQTLTQAFGSTNLKYEWQIDGQDIEDASSSILSFTAGESGAQHMAEVVVTDLRSDHSISATALADIYVSSTSSNEGNSIISLAASLLDSAPKVTLAITGFILLMIAIFAILRSVSAGSKQTSVKQS
ncbi:hypothetical protein ACFL1U_00550 [Patescibacteria group bacterium]